MMHPEIAGEDSATVHRTDRARSARMMAPCIPPHVFLQFRIALHAETWQHLAIGRAAGAHLRIQLADEPDPLYDRLNVVLTPFGELIEADIGGSRGSALRSVISPAAFFVCALRITQVRKFLSVPRLAEYPGL